ncbi:MAG TPA: c-type cytochrome [Vicinamibacterales bacterium]|nr:c-type cytochrome [Vicinamibacterales bacterium]
MPTFRAAALLLAVLTAAIGAAPQEPPAAPPGQGRGGRGRGGQGTREFLGLGRQPDAEIAARGETLYAASCAFCHGADARGAGAPSLMRSEIVLHDDRGELLGPIIRDGRPDKGMPPMAGVTPTQSAEIAEYLHLLVERAANRGLYGSIFANDILTGDATAGAAFFGAHCSTCHSATGDLAHVGSKYQPVNLQNRWLWPSGGRGRGAAQATVTTASGARVSGTVRRLDDFDVSIVDAAGAFHAWPRDQVTVEVADPLKDHRALLARYTDADVHNVTAYLATLK